MQFSWQWLNEIHIQTDVIYIFVGGENQKGLGRVDFWGNLNLDYYFNQTENCELPRDEMDVLANSKRFISSNNLD